MYQGMLMLLALAATTNSASDGQLRLKTDRVVVFKDGYALFVKTAEGIADDRGRVFTTEVPDGAILGSFWAFADGKPSLAMRAEWVDKVERKSIKTTATGFADVLRANRGKKVTLHFVDTAKAELTGTIVAVLDVSAEPRSGPPAELTAETPITLNFAPAGGELLMIESDQGRTVLPI